MRSAGQRGQQTAVTIDVDPAVRVSGILQLPDDALACLLLAHGAGAGMTHPFMTTVAEGLDARAIGTLRYQFPYMEQGAKRPDRPLLAHATVRAAVRATVCHARGLPLFAGGKSFGGRMTSQAQAESPLPAVRGLVFFGFPLHPAGKSSVERGDHLSRIAVPMLFLQGTRDALAEYDRMRTLVTSLGSGATLHVIEGGDHSFKVPARSGRSNGEALGEALDALAAWVKGVIRRL